VRVAVEVSAVPVMGAMARFGTLRGSRRHQGVPRSLPHLLKLAARTGSNTASGARSDEVAFSIRIAKGRGIFDKLGRLTKPCVLMLTVSAPLFLLASLLFRFVLCSVDVGQRN
jgi:hypothetical protein